MKKFILLLVVAAMIGGTAFAQIALGVSGVQYYEKDENGNLPKMGEAWQHFLDGQGVYWGGFVELLGQNYAAGLSFNAQIYDYVFGVPDMWNYDVNISLAYHFFGAKAFIDPFVQAGIGIMAYDYVDRDQAASMGWYTDYDGPLMGSGYFDVGLGIGLNFGSLGIFTKAMYNSKPFELYDEANNEIWGWPILPFKWIFGAKFIF